MKKISTFCLLSVAIFAAPAFSQSLPESTPETEGVSSSGIIAFLDAAAKSKSEFHSIVVLRHGKVIAEGWWNPYKPELKHMMYSTSKSFTSTAIGFAVSERRMTVDDKVIGFFKQYLPDTVSPRLAMLSVRDLLTMSVGQKTDQTGVVIKKENWVKQFLAMPIQENPGSRFLYNSMATYMLSAIVQKVTGQREFDYLKPRLFDPLGITDVDWEMSPEGINTGGWGLRLRTEDMAKFGQLYLQKGYWEGKQVIPEKWVIEATASHIDTDPAATSEKRNTSDWIQGYGYQFWRSRNNSFRADGAFGQFILVLPDRDAVIAITCNSTETQKELDLVWDYLLPAMHEGKLSANKKSADLLKLRLNSLSLPVEAKKDPSPMTSVVSGKSFSISPNRLNIKSVSFDFKNDSCVMKLDNGNTTYPFVFSPGNWVVKTTQQPTPALTAAALGNTVGITPYKVAGSYSWTNSSDLKLELRYVEGPHKETFLCHFEQGKVSIVVDKTLSEYLPKRDTVLVNGVMK